MSKPKFHNPKSTRDIITTGQENIAIVGETDSGKSQALVPIANQYLQHNSVFLITYGFQQKPAHKNLTLIERKPFDRKYTGELDFQSINHEVIIIDELGILFGKEESSLLMTMKEKQDTKFIVTSQSFLKKYEEVTDKLFIGHCSKTTLNNFYNESLLSESSQCEHLKRHKWMMFNKSS